MADGGCNSQFGAQERGAKFGDEFLTGIGLATMAAREISVETGDMPRPVTIMPISA